MSLVPTQAKAKVSISVDSRDLGSFMTKEGGATTAESLKTRPGGGEDQVAYGSPSSHETITVAKLYDSAMKANSVWLKSVAVGNKRGVITDQPLDADNNPFGAPDTYTGVLIRFTPPSRDANANDFATCELEFDIDGVG